MPRTLAVWPTSSYDLDFGKHVLPDGGAFDATNPFYFHADPTNSAATLNWGPGTVGHLRYIDAASNRIYARFGALYDKPQVHVYKDSNVVWGYVTQANVPVKVTLKRGATPIAVASGKSDQIGYFWVRLYDTDGNPALIAEGDSVVVEASAPFTITVPRLTGQVNVETDIVSGEGPANAVLNVIASGSGQSVTADGSGAYSAAFRGLRDIQAGNQIEVQYHNADGHRVYIVFYAGPKLFAQLNSPVAWGYAPAANTPVTVTLKTGATVKGTDVTRSGSNKSFWAYLYDSVGQRVLIAAGDSLEVDFGGGNVATLPIVGLTADVNTNADTITGTGPTNTLLGVEVGNFRQTVTTDASGAWSANATGIEDITPGEQVLARHINTNGDEVWLYTVAPVVYVRASGSGNTSYMADNYVSGYAARYAVVDIALKRGGATVSTRRLTASGEDGYYSTSLYDGLGLNANIQGGDQLVIAASAPFTVLVPAPPGHGGRRRRYSLRHGSGKCRLGHLRPGQWPDCTHRCRRGLQCHLPGH